MAETLSHCPSCGGPLLSAATPEGGALRCPRCGAAIGVPAGQSPSAAQSARPEATSPLTSGTSAHLTIEGGGAGKRPSPSAVGSWLGIPAGAIAGVVLWMLALNPGGWSDLVDLWGLRYLLVFFPLCGAMVGYLCGAVVGSLVGLTIPRENARQSARESAHAGATREMHANPSPDRTALPVPGSLRGLAAEGETWWKIVRASAKGSVRGVIIGTVAGVLYLILVGGGGSSDGTAGAVILVVPIVGALVGFFLGLIIPLLRAWWRTGLPPAVGSMWGTFAGVVAGVVWAIRTEALGASHRWSDMIDAIMGFGFYGAVYGFFVGFVIALLGTWWRTGLTSAARSMHGTFAGALAGVAWWILLAGWGSLFGQEMDTPILVFAIFGAVAGFLLGLATWLIGHGWKSLRSARQSSRAPAVPSVQTGRLAAESAVYSNWALALAALATAVPVVGIVTLVAGWVLRASAPIPGRGSPHDEIRELRARVASYAGLFGVATAVGALVCASWAAVKYEERSTPALCRRRRAFRLALLGLLLNGTPLPWLFHEAPLWPAKPAIAPFPIANPTGPSANPKVSRPPAPGPGKSESKSARPSATARMQPEGGPRRQGPAPAPPPGR